MFVEGIKYFEADETLAARRRVKIDTSNTTADTAKILYADAGEDFIGVVEISAATGDIVPVRLKNQDGTQEVEVEVSSAIYVGSWLYGADDGKLTDAVNGQPQAIALDATSTSNEHIEVVFVEQTKSKQILNIPLFNLRTGSNYAIAASNANFGLIGSDTTPKLAPINAAVNACQILQWTAGNSDLVWTQLALPPDLSTSDDLEIHARVAATSATDVPSFTISQWYNEGDTKVDDTLAASAATSTYGEVTATVAAADVPSGAQTLTIGITPGTHASNAFNLSALWIEYVPTGGK